MTRDPVRIGVVPYLNARPLVMGLDEDPGVARVVQAVPSQLAEGLAADELDCILGSVVLLLDPLAPVLVDGPVIACDGEVETVLLHSRLPLDEIRTVHGDPASRTSNELCSLILGARADGPAQFTPRQEADAIVKIGDEAFSPPPDGYVHTTDLGRAWKELTGLPFVFAGWMARDTEIASHVSPIVKRAAALGVAHLEEIARDEAPHLGISSARALRYLRQRIAYELDSDLHAGLDTFLDAVRAGALRAR